LVVVKERRIKINIHNYNYKIIDDYAEIYFTDKKGINHVVYLDIDNLDILLNFNYKFNPCKWRYGYYMKACVYEGIVDGKYKYSTPLLHRLILNIDDKRIKVDHRDYNGLDNRRKNLRVTDNINNMKNRHGKNSNNKSGYRNVSWNGNTWSVQLQIDGKNTTLKRFPKDQLDEAGEYAEEMRKLYYGEFSGKT
jgi:hypothetical protein